MRLMALALLLFVTSGLPAQANAKRIFVPKQHRRLQSAIDAAAAGDTIWVAPGTYFGPFTIKKRLVIFADEGHGIRRPENRRDILRRSARQNHSLAIGDRLTRHRVSHFVLATNTPSHSAGGGFSSS